MICRIFLYCEEKLARLGVAKNQQLTFCLTLSTYLQNKVTRCNSIKLEVSHCKYCEKYKVTQRFFVLERLLLKCLCVVQFSLLPFWQGVCFTTIGWIRKE